MSWVSIKKTQLIQILYRFLFADVWCILKSIPSWMIINMMVVYKHKRHMSIIAMHYVIPCFFGFFFVLFGITSYSYSILTKWTVFKIGKNCSHNWRRLNTMSAHEYFFFLAMFLFHLYIHVQQNSSTFEHMGGVKCLGNFD